VAPESQSVLGLNDFLSLSHGESDKKGGPKMKVYPYGLLKTKDLRF
jgi:hypothetical protein